MTVGGSGPCLTGVLPPFCDWGDPPPILLNLSGTPWFAAPPMFPSREDCPPAVPLAWSLPSPPALFGGNGLLRMSFSVDDDDDGVRTGDWLGASLVEPMDDGEAVPSLESLFFLDDLFGSLPRESYRQERLVSMVLLGLDDSHPESLQCQNEACY